jgi:hypothetical protein
VHVVDEFFWYMSFRSTKHAEKVQSSIFKLVDVIALASFKARIANRSAMILPMRYVS